jgi:hypothetical protein
MRQPVCRLDTCIMQNRTPANVLRVRAEFEAKLLELERLGQRADALLEEIQALRISRGPTFSRWLWQGLTGKGWKYEIV